MSKSAKPDAGRTADFYDPTAYEPETASGKLARKSGEMPFMPIGLTAALFGVLYGAYNFRKRGAMSPSIYLIHLRVGAQGAVVAALTLGVAYHLFQDYVMPHHEEPEKK